MSSKKHDFNVRAMARVQANADVARKALYNIGESLSQMQVGPSIAESNQRCDRTMIVFRELEEALAKLERQVCS